MKDQAGQHTGGISEALEMSLGLPKCSMVLMVAGKLTKRGPTNLPTGQRIEEVPYGETYRYLGKRISKEYLARVGRTWSSGLCAKDSQP